jgi:hypothetical protein
MQSGHLGFLFKKALMSNQIKLESLILAQNERWRRA